jgi:hypothetical protein
MFFRRALTTIALASTLQAFGSGNGSTPNLLAEMGFDIVSSAWEHAAVVKPTEAGVASCLEDIRNRVGMTRITREGTLVRMGAFLEYTDEVELFSDQKMEVQYYEKMGFEVSPLAA